MDAFFITGREPDADFTRHNLEGSELVCFKGGQQNAMFRYACHKAGVDYDKIITIIPVVPPTSTGRSGHCRPDGSKRWKTGRSVR